MSTSGDMMSSQRVIMSVRAGGTTDMIVQITVPRTTGDYGVLIPVPSEPTLDMQPVSSAEMSALDRITAPYIESSDDGSSGSGCGCMSVSAAGEPKGRGVIAGDQVNIGPVVAVSLKGDDAGAVNAWLTDHGFRLPNDDAGTLASYVNAGSYFIAIRRSESAASGGPSSVGIHYTLQGDHRTLSLGFTKIGAAPTLAFTLFIAAPQAIGPSAPFAAITLNDLDATKLRSDDYKGAVQDAVSSHGSRAFVLEGTTPQYDIIGSARSIAQFMDGGAVITRATTVIDRARLADDVVFATPVTGTIPNSRQVSLSARQVSYASTGSLGILLVLHALRRRGRRR